MPNAEADRLAGERRSLNRQPKYKGALALGRKDKSYSKNLHQQAYERLTGMQAFGESKREAKENGTDAEKIFSASTYQSYWKHTKYFIQYIKENHPECTTLKSAKKVCE